VQYVHSRSFWSTSACDLVYISLFFWLLEVLEILENFNDMGKKSVWGMRKPVFVLFERTTLIFHARCESAAEQY
jgi:hypothetical protein